MRWIPTWHGDEHIVGGKHTNTSEINGQPAPASQQASRLADGKRRGGCTDVSRPRGPEALIPGKLACGARHSEYQQIPRWQNNTTNLPAPRPVCSISASVHHLRPSHPAIHQEGEQQGNRPESSPQQGISPVNRTVIEHQRQAPHVSHQILGRSAPEARVPDHLQELHLTPGGHTGRPHPVIFSISLLCCLGYCRCHCYSYYRRRASTGIDTGLRLRCASTPRQEPKAERDESCLRLRCLRRRS